MVRISLTVILLFAVNQAYADDATIKALTVIDDIPNRFYLVAKAWLPIIHGYAIKLYFSLGLIYFTWNIGMKILQKSTAEDFVAEALRFIVTFGLFLWLLNAGPNIAGLILDSFRTMAVTALKASPSNAYIGMNESTSVGQLIYESILLITNAIMEANTFSFSFKGVITSLYMIVLLFAVVIIIGLIGGNLIIEYISAYVLICVGSFVLAFGSTSWFRDTTIRYFKAIFVSGMRIMTVLLLINVTTVIIMPLITSEITLVSACMINISLLILLKLSNSLPATIAGLIGEVHGQQTGFSSRDAIQMAGLTIMGATSGMAYKAYKNMQQSSYMPQFMQQQKQIPQQQPNNSKQRSDNSGTIIDASSLRVSHSSSQSPLKIDCKDI